MKRLALVVVAVGCSHPAHVHEEPVVQAKVEPAFRHSRMIAFTLTPDATIAASGAGDGTVIVWDLQSKTKVASFRTKFEAVTRVALSDDGKQVAVGDSSSHVELWDVATGQLTRELTPSALEFTFSPDGARLIGSMQGTTWIWDVATGHILWSSGTKRKRELVAPPPAAIAADGHSAIEMVGINWREERGGDVEYSMPSTYTPTYVVLGSEERTLDAGNDPEPKAVGISRDGKRVALLGSTHLVVLDATTGLVITKIAVPDRPVVKRLEFGDDPELVFGMDSTMIAWNLHTGRELWQESTRYGAPPRLAARNIIVYRRGATCIARMLLGRVLWQRENCDVAVSPASTKMLLACGDDGFDLADLTTGQ